MQLHRNCGTDNLERPPESLGVQSSGWIIMKSSENQQSSFSVHVSHSTADLLCKLWALRLPTEVPGQHLGEDRKKTAQWIHWKDKSRLLLFFCWHTMINWIKICYVWSTEEKIRVLATGRRCGVQGRQHIVNQLARHPPYKSGIREEEEQTERSSKNKEVPLLLPPQPGHLHFPNVFPAPICKSHNSHYWG